MKPIIRVITATQPTAVLRNLELASHHAIVAAQRWLLRAGAVQAAPLPLPHVAPLTRSWST